MAEIADLKQRNGKITQELNEIKKKYEETTEENSKGKTTTQLQLHCKICNKMVLLSEVDRHSKTCLAKQK